MTGTALEPTYRIGQVAERVGVTPRTIRYYEELGLLVSESHVKGAHRLYSEADVARLLELIRLRDLLGVSLDELKALIEVEDARAVLRDRFAAAADDEERSRLLERSLEQVERQLALVRARQETIGALRKELEEKRERIRARLDQIGAPKRTG